MIDHPRLLAPLGAGLLLSACGGGGGGEGVPFIPPSPPIQTNYSYARTVDLPAASHQLQAPYIKFDRTLSDLQFTAGEAPLSISFDKSAGTYTLSATGDSSRSFSAADRATSTGPDFEAYTQAVGGDLHRFSMQRGPGVLLTYMMFGGWDDIDNLTGNATLRTFVTGSFTKADDMPTGNATYAMTTTGGISRHDGEAAGPIEAMSSVTLSVDFQSGQVSTTLHLVARPPFAVDSVDYGRFSGTAAIAATTSSYTGQLQGERGTGVFVGGFFGPKAIETGYIWAIAGDDFHAVGNASGDRNLK